MASLHSKTFCLSVLSPLLLAEVSFRESVLPVRNYGAITVTVYYNYGDSLLNALIITNVSGFILIYKIHIKA